MSGHVTVTGVFSIEGARAWDFKYTYENFAAGTVGRVLRRHTLCWRSSTQTWSPLQIKA